MNEAAFASTAPPELREGVEGDAKRLQLNRLSHELLLRRELKEDLGRIRKESAEVERCTAVKRE